MRKTEKAKLRAFNVGLLVGVVSGSLVVVALGFI